ncbi:MAG: hypothetical protein M1415_05465 [Firmicutes bacterium]|nr:hypothetical protein [Bacillota bacterium]MCL5064177.1 hypothetical protein [Bacillota bacterium]
MPKDAIDPTVALFQVQDEEPHLVVRACGHEETLWLGPPWDYVDTVASQVVCTVCRKSGQRGPLDRENAFGHSNLGSPSS